MRSSVALLSAAALAVSGVLVAPGAATASDPVGQVLSATADPGPFYIHGGFAGQAQSIITVKINQPIYQPGGCRSVEWDYTGVEVSLERTTGGGHEPVKVDLPHVGSTGTVHTYQAPWRIATTLSGTWTLTGITWCDLTVGVDPSNPGDVYSNLASVDPRVDPGVTASIDVAGMGVWPYAVIELIPATVPYRDLNDPTSSTSPLTRQFARVTYRTATGAPIVGATVLSGREYACFGEPMPPTPGGGGWVGETLRTDARGQVTIRLVMEDLGQTCAFLLGPPAVPGDMGTRALELVTWPYPHHLYKRVSAVPTVATVRVNRTVTVIGSSYPGRGVVRLQRLVGRTWRTVASAPIRRSGRYALYGKVATLGRNYFRVVALNGDPTLAPTPSHVVLVTGTRR